MHLPKPYQYLRRCRLRVHEESNINPNSDCGVIYGYYWWIFCLNFLAWCGACFSNPSLDSFPGMLSTVFVSRTAKVCCDLSLVCLVLAAAD